MNREEGKGCGQRFTYIGLLGDGGLAIYLNWIIGGQGYAESGLFNTKIVPNGI